MTFCTRSLLVCVLATLAAAAVLTFLLDTFVDVQPMWAVQPRRLPGGVWVTYRPDPDFDSLYPKLQQRVDLPDGMPAGTPLEQALRQLGEKYEVTFLLDTETLSASGIANVRSQSVRLPKLLGVSLATTLRLLLAQIQGEQYSGTYRIGPRGIEITTTARRFVRRPGRVDVRCDYEPFDQVMKELTDKADYSVVMDPAIGELASRPVTADLKDVERGTAVRVLAEMAGLAVAEAEGVECVVSTKERIEMFLDGNSTLPARSIPEPVRRDLEPLIPAPNRR